MCLSGYSPSRPQCRLHALADNLSVQKITGPFEKPLAFVRGGESRDDAAPSLQAMRL
jgi:hypothetical protein